MCKETDNVEPIIPFKTPIGLPDPGTKTAIPDDPIIPPRHKTKFSQLPNPLEGITNFPEIDLSPISD